MDFKEYVQQLHPLVINSNYYCLFVTPTDEYQGKEYFELPLDYINARYESGIVLKVAEELHLPTGRFEDKKAFLASAAMVMKTIPALFATKESLNSMSKNIYFGYVTNIVKKEKLFEVYFKLLLMLPKHFLIDNLLSFNLYDKNLECAHWDIRQAAHFIENFEKLTAALQDRNSASE